MSATILLGDRECVERIRSEGGLRVSFCTVFRGSLFDTADDTPRSDGQGFDDLLNDFKLVCLDSALLKPIEEGATNRDDCKRYRSNLLAKVASRSHVWLEVIHGEDQEKRIEELEARISESKKAFGSNSRKCIVVLVFTEVLSDKAREIVERLSKEPNNGVGKVYVMFHRLQLSSKGMTAAAAINVWPLCVARLLAFQALNEKPLDKNNGMYVWRTFLLGSVELSNWAAKYRTMLRENLLPTNDNEDSDQTHSRKLDRTSVGTFCSDGNPFDGQSKPAVRWSGNDDGASIREGAFSYVSEQCFLEKLESAGSEVKCKRALDTSVEKSKEVHELSQNSWGEVATSSTGLQNLRRLKDGRMWSIVSLKELHEGQRDQWGSILAGRRRLNIARENHRDASEEVSIARNRHLSLLWRMIIAFAVILFIGQFLFSALSPLRPPVEESKGWAAIFEELKGTDFWGLKVDNGQTVYVVDCSGSMEGERFNKTKQKLKESIEGLPEHSKYCVVFFHSQIHRFKSTDLTFATKDAKKATLAELEAMSAGGGTDPTSTLAFALDLLKIPDPLPQSVIPVDPAIPGSVNVLVPAVAPPPSLIVLMTDGVFQDNESVLRTIEEFNSKRGKDDKVKVNTVAIDFKSSEDFLKKIAADNGGDYKYVEFAVFDFFAPLGFNLVLALILAASALGVTVGAVLLWWLEVWRGKKACGAINSSLMGLRREFGHLARETQKLLEGSQVIRLSGNHNAAATAQRALAARAYAVVEQLLFKTRTNESSARSSVGGFGWKLFVEDGNDVRRTLDVPLSNQNEEELDELNKELEKIASEDSKVIGEEWEKLCMEFDCFRRGHLPSNEIERVLGTQLETNIDKVSTVYMWSSFTKDVMDKLANELVQRLRCDSVRACISGRVDIGASGQWPASNYKIFVLKPPENLEMCKDQLEQMKIKLKESLTSKIVQFTEDPVANLGLTGLGLAHEELQVHFDFSKSMRDPDCDVILKGPPESKEPTQ